MTPSLFTSAAAAAEGLAENERALRKTPGLHSCFLTTFENMLLSGGMKQKTEFSYKKEAIRAWGAFLKLPSMPHCIDDARAISGRENAKPL